MASEWARKILEDWWHRPRPLMPEEGLMPTWKKYRRTGITEMRRWVPGMDMAGISISETDKLNGSPRDGDMIARNVNNHADQWLVSAKFFADTGFAEIEPDPVADAADEMKAASGL